MALGEAALDDRDLRRQILIVLGEVIPFDFFAWLLTDPVTMVGAAPLAEVPRVSELPDLIKAKYATSVNRWTVLLRQASPAALLGEATGGELARSRIWREVMSRYSVSDVASAVFADQYGCWGFLDLWRHRSHGPFDTADADFLAALTAPLARALRLCQARTFVKPAAAHRYHTGPVPASVYNVAAQLLSAEEGIDDHPAVTRTHLAGGIWLTLRAARLSSEHESPASAGGGTIVVTIEEASSADRLDLFGRAFGFTARERELLSLLAIGSDTRALARQMSVSEHTIQDHLKAIFVKTGSRDRITLLSRALGTRSSDVDDRSAARRRPAP